MRATINSKAVDFDKNGDKILSDYKVQESTQVHILGRMLGGILWINLFLFNNINIYHILDRTIIKIIAYYKQ